MKIKNITIGTLQDTKMGWVIKSNQILEVDETKPEILERVRQLVEHKLIEVVEGNLPGTASVTVVEVTDQAEPATQSEPTQPEVKEAVTEPSEPAQTVENTETQDVQDTPQTKRRKK